MNKRFQSVNIATEDNPNPGYWGYFCSQHVSEDDIKESNSLPESIKSNPHIYKIRNSDDDSHKATIEPKAVINFAGSFITDEDLFKSFNEEDDKYLSIIKFKCAKKPE